MDALIRAGDHVILDENNEKKTIHYMQPSLSVKIGKRYVSVGHLVGSPWGATYQLAADGASLERLATHTSILGPKVEEVEKDNSQLVDGNDANQSLTHEDIEAMKAQGTAGEHIIDALCKSSATYEGKTEYAQDKYKKRKARKYLVTVTLRRPTARLLCEALYDKCPAKVWNLRPDTLGILLCLANVAAHSRVLVVESCQGLLAAAVAERLGGYGAVCCSSPSDRPAPLDMLRQLNFSEQQRGVVCCAPLAALLEAKEWALRQQQQQLEQQQQQQQEQQSPGHQADPSPSQAADAAGQQHQQPPPPGPSTSAPAAALAATAVNGVPAAAAQPDAAEPSTAMDAGDEAAEPATTSGAGEQQQQQQQQQQQEEVLAGSASGAGQPPKRVSYTASWQLQRKLVQPGFSSLIIASPTLQPAAALEAVWPLLAPSASWVVYSPWLQPLAEAFAGLTASKRAVMMQLQESWLRPYQVLPGRSHPHMNMTTGGTGGYLLSGIAVHNSPAPAAAAGRSSGATPHQRGGGKKRGRS